MQSNNNNLLAAYKRRALLTRGLLTVLTTSMAVAPLASIGQAQNTTTPPAAVQTPPAPGAVQATQVPGAAQTGAPQTGAAPAGGAPQGQGGAPTTIIPRQRRGGAQGDGSFTISPDGSGGRGSRGFGAPGGGTPFSFDFRGADIANVLKLYAQMSGQTITADSTLSGNVTIINPKPVQLDEAFRILQSVLASRGFTALQTGNVISILPINGAAKSTTYLNSDKDPMRLDPRNQVMTQIIPLDNVDANALAKDLQPLISTGASLIGSSGTNALILTDTATNVQRFLAIVDSLDKTSANAEIVIYPLRRAEAANVASVINDLYSKINSRAPGTPTGIPGQPQGPQGQQGQGAGAAARPSVVAEPDPRTNSVIVVASRDKQTEIAKKLIATLDDDDSNTMDTRFIKIKYADASTVADLINTTLSNLHGASGSGSGGGASFQQRAFGGFNPFGFGGGNQNNSGSGAQSTDPFGKVVAEPRTNSVVVTANAEKMAKIEELIKQVDVAVPTETTTFVIKLKNANASDVSTALGQAFGTTQNNQNNGTNTNRNGTTSSSNNGTQRTATNRSFGSSSSPGGRQAAPAPPPGPQSSQGTQDDGSAMPQGVQGVMTANGFVPTSADQSAPTRQFGGFGGGGFGGGGGQNRGRQGSTLGASTSPQYGRGSNGSYVNLLQLQNNVFSTPTPNGDSIIVTTTPDNIAAVKSIVEQLDIVPRQVMIEVVVAEVTLSSDQKLGFSAAGMLNRLFHSATTGGIQSNTPITGFNTGTTGTALDAAATGFQFVLNNANYSAVLQVLDDSTNVNILATPKVFTSNNQQATIDIQQFIPYITGQASSGLAGTTVANQVQYLQVGFSLVVTPRITREGQVTMDLTQEASELLNYQTLGTGQGAIQAPVTNDRYTDTEVTVQDNETVVIGGLIRQSNNVNRVKIPLLGDIPLIGQLFQSKSRSHEKQELVIFVTPHVVNNSEEARALTQKMGQNISRQIPELGKEQSNLDYFNKKKKAPAVAPGAPTTNPDGSTPQSMPDKPATTSGSPVPNTPVPNTGTQNPNIKP
ncbi:MAG: Type secretory pathway, component PulD [Chthonomonadaceae bacterium]|nr:Type secretory pathway, component PulD [Chthonomonadaceae bacterium]